MKTISIKTKVVLTVATCLALGAALLIGLVRTSYRQNVNMVARDALDSARKSYESLRDDRTATLATATAVVSNVDSVRQLYLARDRDGLLEQTKPAFEELKKQGVLHFLYLDTEANIFLRMHKPKAFGDSVKFASFVQKAMETKTIAADIDLVAAGFSVGSCRPYYDKDNKLIGYMIGGGTLDDLLVRMKHQTTDDYKLVGSKKSIDQALYRKTQAQKGLADKWNQFANVIIFSETETASANTNYEQEMAGVPASGKLLGETAIDGRVYIRGVFPLVNILGKTTGGIFVRHDITQLHNGMQKVQNIATAAIVGLMVLISFVLVSILNRLVFARLKQTMNTATRVVGGEFDRQIIPVSDDEVGKLEALLEQFRAIFVNVVNDLSARQANEEQK